MSMTAKQFTEQVNLLINKAVGGGLAFTAIVTALNTQATALTTAAPGPYKDRTLKDSGPALNPSQP